MSGSSDIIADVTAVETGSLSVRNRNLIDVSQHGFSGSVNDGDLAAFILQNPDSTFYLPEGEYAIEQIVSVTDWDHFGMIGGGNGARLIPTDTAVSRIFTVGATNSAIPVIVVQNITLDIRGTHDCAFGWFFPGEKLLNEDLLTLGQRDRGGGTVNGDVEHYRCEVLEPDGVAVHRNVKHPDGDTVTDDSAIGFRSGGSDIHLGTNIWEACYVERFFDNGFYLVGSPEDGKQILIGCEARNCGNQMLRLGNGCLAINCSAILDEPIDTDIAGMLALRDSGENLTSPESPGSPAVYGFTAQRSESFTGGPQHTVWVRDVRNATIKDLYVENTTSHHSLSLASVQDDDEKGRVVVENARIHDSGGTSIREAAVRIGRKGAILRDCYVSSPNRRCLYVDADGTECLLDNCRFEGSSSDIRLQSGTGGYLTLRGGSLVEGISILDQSPQIDTLTMVQMDLTAFAAYGDIFPVEEPEDQGIEHIYDHNMGPDKP